jgi:hypothetical protein
MRPKLGDFPVYVARVGMIVVVAAIAGWRVIQGRGRTD